MNADLSSAKLSVLLAILVENVQQDRFCKGILLQMLANGYLLQLLTQIENCYHNSDQKYNFVRLVSMSLSKPIVICVKMKPFKLVIKLSCQWATKC